ncbi:unnamed protein product, partial [Cuscuta epithymum]
MMGDTSVASVQGIGKVEIKFPLGKVLSLHGVHHVPEIRRNIVSGSILVKEGYELSFKLNKVVILFGGIFIGKGYLSDGLFKIVVDYFELNYVFENCDSSC